MTTKRELIRQAKILERFREEDSVKAKNATPITAYPINGNVATKVKSTKPRASRRKPVADKALQRMQAAVFRDRFTYDMFKLVRYAFLKDPELSLNYWAKYRDEMI